MFKLVLLFLALSGLQALPLARRLQKTPSTYQLPDGFRQGTELFDMREPVSDFRQGTEPSRRFIVDLNTGLLQEHMSKVDRRDAFTRPLGKGLGEMEGSHLLANEVPEDVPAQKNVGGAGWVRVEKPSDPRLPDGFRQGTEPMMSLPDDFRQGTEPMMSLPDDFRQGTEPMMSLPDDFRQGTEPIHTVPESFREEIQSMRSIHEGLRQGTEPIHMVPDGFGQEIQSKMSIPDGFRQGTEPMMSIPDGFRQGTEPMMSIPEGFRQGTEPMMSIPDGFRQGTEPMMSIPDGFRQGTEPMMSIPEDLSQGTEPIHTAPESFREEIQSMMSIHEGFRQETEPMMSIPEGFRQGTEPMMSIPEGFRQGTEPLIPEGFRQETEHSTPELQTKTVACKGDIINGNCYEFNPTPLTFQDAQAKCRSLAPNAELASVTTGDLHSRLVSLSTNGGENNPVLTWLGGTVKNQKASWVDGSDWSYSDWMPGHPNIHTDKPVCVEMFKIDESWWTAADCDLKRASICSYQITA
ncbi:uncharacterized protein LOC117499192 isoform X5 [Trematomus bernacchii]|uniref:uncharacterized protein LOC117499192 isoform X5 n=1 Tax=Trematomus bernacchii TaxID=40690 RepID=UPI00146B8564|nr:uncharacterized protein LOC117499192 isoform X5 [Trematomus bernacchii]